MEAAVIPPLIPSFADIVSGKLGNLEPPSPRTSSKSFSDILSNGGSSKLKKPSLFRGEPAVFFSKDDVDKLSSPFKYTLIGKFSYWRPRMEVIRKFFNSLGLKSLKSVGLIHDNHVVIFISNQEDYSRLLFRSTWFVNGAPMKVSKWSPDFFPHCESPVVPVWLGFPGLPLHFFEKSVLYSLASIFGVPLKTDEPTSLLSRPSVARVCVDMDVSKPRGNRIWLGDEKVGFWQEVVFENPPPFCDFCKKLGHAEALCFIKNPVLKKVITQPGNLQKEKILTNPKESDKDILTWKPKTISATIDEDGWQTQKRKSNKGLKFVEGKVTRSQSFKVSETSKFIPPTAVQGVSNLASGLGVYLTPFNPKKSSNLVNSSSSDVAPSFNNLGNSQKTSIGEEKDNFSIPAQLVSINQSQPLSNQMEDIAAPLGHNHHFNTEKKSKLSFSRNERDTSSQSVVNLENGIKNDVSSLHPKSVSVDKIGPSIDQGGKQIQQWIEGVSHSQQQLSSICGPHKHVSGSSIEFQPLLKSNLQIQPSIAFNDGSHKLICEKEIAIQPSFLSLPLGGGSHKQFSGSNIDLQPLIGVKLPIQPLSSISSGSHDVVCEREIVIEPQHLSPTHGSGSHKQSSESTSGINPCTVGKLQSLPSSSKGITCENIFYDTSNIGPNLLVGPENSIEENSSSSGPVFMDNIISPNDILVINPMGHVDNIISGRCSSEHGKQVQSSYDFIYIQSLFFSFLADHNINMRPSLRKVMVEYFSILGSSIGKSWEEEISWFFIQKYLLKFCKDSGVAIPKKMRRVFNMFFQEATREERPFTNAENLGMCRLNQEVNFPIVEDTHSDTDEYVSN